MTDGPSAFLVDVREAPVLDVLGPTVRFVTAGDEADGAPCVMLGTIPPGGAVPLHSHPDPETFHQVSGAVEGLAASDEGVAWIPIRPGDTFHVPGGARHAFRNLSAEPAVAMIVTTARLGRFMREIGTIADRSEARGVPPSPEVLERLQKAARRHGHWNGTPRENAALGVPLGAPAPR